MYSILCDYIESSWEPNMIMSGLEKGIDKRYSSWTKKDVSRLKRALNRKKFKNPRKRLLYRGGYHSPILEEITKEEAMERFQRKESIMNLSPLSTSTSKEIAKEFGYLDKYLHILHVDTSVEIIDLKDIDCKGLDDNSQKAQIREKEILIAPKQRLIPYKKYGKHFHWIVKGK